MDWGETSLERPDIAVLKPAPKTIKDKFGNDQKISNPHVWDYTTTTAVEIEMSAQKSKEQLLRNCHKNKDFYEQIRFVVTSLNTSSSSGRSWARSSPPTVKYRVDVMEFESLNTIEPKPQEESNEPEEPLSTGQQVNAEEKILSYIKGNTVSRAGKKSRRSARRRRDSVSDPGRSRGTSRS